MFYLLYLADSIVALYHVYIENPALKDYIGVAYCFQLCHNPVTRKLVSYSWITDLLLTETL